MAFLNNSEIAHKSPFFLRILANVCILTNDRLSNKFPKMPPICYKLLLHGPLTFTFTILMWLEVVNSSDLNQACDVLYIALTETALIVKIVAVWHYDSLIKCLFNEWQENEMFQLQTREEYVIWQRTVRTFNIQSFLYISISLTFIACVFVSALFRNNYQLPFPFWTPFNTEMPANYWSAYFYQLLAMPLTCISNSALDMLLCYMLQYLALQFKLIQMRLETLGAKRSEIHAGITKKLLAIIEFHLKLKRMCNSCEAIVSYPFLVQIFLSAFVLCFSLYRLQNFNILQDYFSFLSLVQYCVVMNLQIFLPCFYGSNLTIESANLLNSIYKSNWPELSAYNRNVVKQYMQYLQQPVTLRAGNFFYVNLATYSKAMNYAYNFLALLLNMENE